MVNKLVVIDGNSLFYRSFYALPLLSNSDGEYSNAVYGFAIQILNIIQNIKPKYIAVAFDAGKHTFRNELYSGYKATRKPMPDELRHQINPLKNMLRLMNISIVEKPELEGDDILGIITKQISSVENIIVTGDRDSFQLVDKNTSVYFTKKGTSDVKIIDLKSLKEEYGVTPEQFIDLKALQGDVSDNIPGVAGVGPKTATQLIEQYGNLDNLYAHLDELKGKLKENLEIGKENAYLSKKLATIQTTGQLDVSLEDFVYDYPFSAKVYDFFKKYQFKSLLKNTLHFDLKMGEVVVSDFNKVVLKQKDEIEDLKSKIIEAKQFAVFFESDKIHFSIGDKNEYIAVIAQNFIDNGFIEDDIFSILGSLFEDVQIQKICFDSKQLMYKLKPFKLRLTSFFDCSIAKYLIDAVPVENTHDLFFDDNLDFIASNLFEFKIDYSEKIESQNLKFLFSEVEIPLSSVLFSMEGEGFKVDRNVHQNLKNKYVEEIKQLEKQIYDLAGANFNINSPKQLANILYDVLGLPHDKKRSTSAEKLEEIIGTHEIVGIILRYRKVAKFLNTYIDGLQPHIDANGFIHTYFKQTLTTTGRLSSVEPNLQNIPIRSNESREIRSMFVASDENHILIDADYSQIELRLLAHFSNDPTFVGAFKRGEDIHTQTASSIFGVPPELVSAEMRRTAKVVNFGVIYGISDFGLSSDLKIPVKEAKIYIENFFNKHPKVDEYMKSTIQKAKEFGYAETLFGRKRRLFDINSSNFNLRSRAERASQNMPLQGTAADIIKIAMVKTYNALKSENLKAKLIMQIHDELIINAPVEEEMKVKKILEREMKNACSLSLPLEIDIKCSYRWSDGH